MSPKKERKWRTMVIHRVTTHGFIKFKFNITPLPSEGKEQEGEEREKIQKIKKSNKKMAEKYKESKFRSFKGTTICTRICIHHEITIYKNYKIFQHG